MIEVWLPGLPGSVGVGVTVLALVAAVKFTGWYPKRVRAGAVATD